MTTQKQQPYLNTRDDAAFQFLGLPTLVRASSETTNGAFGLIESWTMPPGFASPYHVHHREDESFYVLEGEIAFVCDGQWLVAGPGTFVFGPREIPHGFKVVGDAPARLLLLCSPAGFERFVLELGAGIDTPPSPPDMALMMSTAAKFGIDILGPLPGQPAAPTVKTDHEKIDLIRQAHIAALTAQDAGGLTNLFVEDAIQMPPNSPANTGKARIHPWAEGFLRVFHVESFVLDVTDLHITGDRAVETGAYRIRLTTYADNHSLEETGKYITVFQKLPDGSWAISRDIWNSDQPLSAIG